MVFLLLWNLSAFQRTEWQLLKMLAITSNAKRIKQQLPAGSTPQLSTNLPEATIDTRAEIA